MTQNAKQRLLNGEAWEDFCEQLKAAGRVVESFGDEPDEMEIGEWYRFLTRLTRNGLERFMENCEPEKPRLRETPWRQSIQVQSPDQDHLLCEFVDGSFDYVIRGNRGTLPYFVMASWNAPIPKDFGAKNWAPLGAEGLKEFDPANLNTTHFLMSDDIDFDEAGNFEVRVSREEQPGNWLPITPDCVGILIRTVHHDRRVEEKPTFLMERLDKPRTRPVRPQEVSEGLAKAAQTVFGYAEMMRAWWQENLGLRPNEIVFSEATYLSNGGVLDRLHGFGSWQKAADEALLIEFVAPACETWILQLCSIWQENLDVYEDEQGYLNKFMANYEEDGLVRIVIADRDPDIGCNWIDSFQHEKGVFSLRLIKTEAAPKITLYRLPLQNLCEAGLAAIEGIEPIVSGQVTA